MWPPYATVPFNKYKSKLTKEEAEESSGCLVNTCWMRFHLQDSAIKSARLLSDLERLNFEKEGSCSQRTAKA